MMVQIDRKKVVQVNVDIIEVHVKCTDRFCGKLKDTDGETVVNYEDTYVPDFFPGQHYGEYLILYIELETGRIINWTPVTKKALEAHLKEHEDD